MLILSTKAGFKSVESRYMPSFQLGKEIHLQAKALPDVCIRAIQACLAFIYWIWAAFTT